MEETLIIYSEDDGEASIADLTIQLKHEGRQHGSDQRLDKETKLSFFNDQLKSEHGSIKYECNQCDYRGISKQHLKDHQRRVHDGIKYQCNQCDYNSYRNDRLKTHQ